MILGCSAPILRVYAGLRQVLSEHEEGPRLAPPGTTDHRWLWTLPSSQPPGGYCSEY